MQTFELIEMKAKTGNFVTYLRRDYTAKRRLVKVAQLLLKQI